MAAKKVGTLIKEARTGADLTQEQLARKVKGLSASDISMAERGQKDLTQAQLKLIAKATGVTQASLINAAKDEDASANKKSTARKSTAAKKSTASKKAVSSSAARSSVRVTAAEKKLLELYREADSDTKKNVLKLLKGEEDGSESILEDILETVQGLLENK
ncbi:MAG: helix-turn-helix transcriptional regulator [Clostridia bacterium]|nr:helix-turn-helix transcriptional regulator [Clostridia bacterium]